MTSRARTLIRFLLPAALLLVALTPASSAEARDRVAFGAWTPGSPFGGDLRATKSLQRTLGRRVKIVSWYQDFSLDPHHFKWNVKRAVRSIRKSGRTPLLTWEPLKWGALEGDPYDAINSGQWDSYIWWWASQVKKLRTPLYVRFAHEFNGNWYTWGGPVGNNSPAKFREAWRRVVNISRQAGATNIKWVWCPLATDVPATRSNRFERYYPGKAYVDVLSVDGYNWGNTRPEWGGWESFRSIFRRAYKRLSRLGPQPIWIAEVGSASSGGDKKAWVRNMWRVAARWDRLKAIVWFNQDGDADWSAVGAASAFRKR